MVPADTHLRDEAQGFRVKKTENLQDGFDVSLQLKSSPRKLKGGFNAHEALSHQGASERGQVHQLVHGCSFQHSS